MKKTDFFKLSLVCAMMLLTGIWSQASAQENKAAEPAKSGEKAQTGSLTSEQVLKMEEQKRKQLQDEPARRAAVVKQQEMAAQQAKKAESERVKGTAQNKAQAKKDAPSPVFIAGTAVANQDPAQAKAANSDVVNAKKAAEAKSNEKPDLKKIEADYTNQVVKITANATSYDAAKREIYSLQDKTIESAKFAQNEANWQNFKNTLDNIMSVQLDKLQENLSNNAKTK